MDLSVFLGRLFGRVMKITPKSGHRLLITFLGIYEDVSLGQPEPIVVLPSPPMPGYWADSEESWSAAANILWDESQWDE